MFLLWNWGLPPPKWQPLQAGAPSPRVASSPGWMLLAPLSGPRGPGADTHHFPSPVCLPHQPSGLDMTQSQTPKTGASLAGRPGFSQVAGEGGVLAF